MPRNYANWLKAYMAFTSDSEAPDDMHFWTGVATIAGALRRRVWIDMRKFHWTPNFYIVLVGPPGIVTKSTTIRAGMRLLEQVKGVNFGPPSITWQKLADNLAAAVEHLDVTDSQGNQVLIPMSCLTIPVSELGTFLKIDDASLIDVLVDLWDGQLTQWGHSTKTSGTTEIKNPWLNIIGCTTPSWLKAHFPEHLIGGGLTSRIVFVFGETKRKLSAYPDEFIADADYRSMEAKLVEDLKEIASLKGSYSISSEARAWGHKWYADHWKTERPSHMASDRYGGYLARKQTHIHKLAIVLAAAQSSTMVIEKNHLEEASMLLESTEPHMLKVFESIGVVEEAKNMTELVAYVNAHSFVTSDQLWKLVMNIMSQKEFNEAMVGACRAGILVVEKRNGKLGVIPGKIPSPNTSPP